MTDVATSAHPGIGDYGFLSDGSTAALVSRDGSVDWWCVPRFDAPSVFGRLLGPDAGAWTLRPRDDARTTRGYVEDTLVLRTVHRTASGAVAVTDALALEPGARGHDVGRASPLTLMRRVEGLDGTVRMTTELAARPEYGAVRPHLRRVDDDTFEAFGGPVRLVASAPVEWRLDGSVARAEFDVRAGRAPGAGPEYRARLPARRHGHRGRGEGGARAGRPRGHDRGVAVVARRPRDLRRRASRPACGEVRWCCAGSPTPGPGR